MSNESCDAPTKIFIKKKKLVIRREQATAVQTAQTAAQPKEQQPKEQLKEQQAKIEQYIAQLSPQERIVLRIAQEHLETSFDIEKSIGYKHFCKK